MACTAEMSSSHLRMLIHEVLNKDSDIVPEEAPQIILDSQSAICMSNNGKDTKHTRHISRRVHFKKNRETWKMHRIEWCEGGVQLADIETKNVGENDLNPRMNYIMVKIGNLERTLIKEEL